MLNEEKIRLMTRVTVYEEGRGIEDSRKARFFQNDFVFAEIVGSIFTGTLAWGVCAAIYCGYYFEDIFFWSMRMRSGRFCSVPQRPISLLWRFIFLPRS